MVRATLPATKGSRLLGAGLATGGFVLLFCFSPRAAAAQGGPPLRTDDPGTPGAGQTELNLAFTVEKFRTETQYGTPLLDVNYGVGDRIQLKAEIPWLIGTAPAQPTQSGLGMLLLGFKYRFLDENLSGVDASVYPQASLSTSAHSRRSGLVPEGMDLLLPAEAAKDLGFLTVNVEGGYLLREEAEEEWVWGIALGHKISEGIELLGEVHGESAKDLDRAQIVWNLGARLQVTKLHSILFSAGRGFRGEARGEPELIGYLGLQFNF